MSESNKYFTRAEISHDVLRELLPVFFDEIDTDFLAMKKAVKNENTELGLKLAHKLKGTSLSYGACLISDTLENYKDQFSSHEKIESLLAALNHAILDTRKYAYANYNL